MPPACLHYLRPERLGSRWLTPLLLQDRSMRVKIGTELSDALTINGGSLKGTLLGNVFFIVSTDLIERTGGDGEEIYASKWTSAIADFNIDEETAENEHEKMINKTL